MRSVTTFGVWGLAAIGAASIWLAVPSAERAASTSTAPAAVSAEAAGEDEAVRKPLNAYLQAQATGKAAFIREAFHPNGTISSVKDGVVKERSVDEFAAVFTGKVAANEAQRKRRIASVDVHGTAATARIELDYPHVLYVDYMSLLKVNGEWKILHKIYDETPRTAPTAP